MTTLMWVILGIGVFGGFYVGRWSAETSAARHDMRRRWNGRKGYRE